MINQAEPQPIPETVAETHQETAMDIPELAVEAKNWAVACHLAALAGLIFFPLFIFAAIFGSLVVWLLKRNDYEYVDVHGKAALNFQITVVAIVLVISVLISTVLGSLFVELFHAYMWVVAVVWTIVAAIKASNGKRYRYPLTIRFLR